MDNTVINTLAENTEERKVCVQDKPLTAAEQAEGSDATAILGESAEIPYYQQRQKTFGYKCYLFFKRAFDLIFSGFLILALSWLYIIIALAVKLADGGSVVLDAWHHLGVREAAAELFPLPDETKKEG